MWDDPIFIKQILKVCTEYYKNYLLYGRKWCGEGKTGEIGNEKKDKVFIDTSLARVAFTITVRNCVHQLG